MAECDREKRVFALTDAEVAAIAAWKEAHKPTCRFQQLLAERDFEAMDTLPGEQYRFNFTGIGTTIVYRCDCGVEENVTDFEGW